MAHYAEIDNNSKVIRVLRVADDKDQDWLSNIFGGTWIQTSYNTLGGVHSEGKNPLRKNFAGVGFSYDSELDAFIPPQPFSNWILDEQTGQWTPPKPMPEEANDWQWNEELEDWTLEDL